MAMTRYPLKDFGGRIIGFIEEQDNGDKTCKDFYGRILGKYYKERNQTHDFYGKIIGKGDLTSALVAEANAKREANRNK